MRPNMNGDWPSLGGRIMRMPFSLTGLVLSAFTSLGLGGAALGIVVPTVVGAIQIGLSIGLSFLASSIFGPKAPKPEDVQQSTRQPTQPRVRHYGRVKVSGPWTFAEAIGGNFHKVLSIGVGPIDAIEEYWIDDKQVGLGGDGKPTDGQWTGGSGEKYVRVLTRLGAATETYYSELAADYAGWTSAHRGDGVASLYATQYAAEDKYYLGLFPNGINTNYRLVLRGAKVTNPVTASFAWDDNAAAIIRDYITHADGMRLPASIVSTPLAQAGWETAYIRASSLVDTKAGDENRYRLWGSYTLEERPADVVGRMLQCCDGRLVPTPDGGLTLDIGEWAEPTVTLDADSIVGFSEVGRGRDILSTANTIRAKYLDPNQDYQAADADPWVDADDVAARGEIASDMDFPMAPSHSQARRLMKLAAFRANPTWVGQFQCNLKALAAFGERFVRVNFPALGINSVFEVQDFRFNIGEGGILQGVTLQLQSMPQAAYTWDAAQEEGDAPGYDESDVDNSIPKPDAPGVTIITGPIARLSFSPAPSVILKIEARGKATADSAWIDIPVTDGATSADSWALTASTEYEFQIRYVTEKGRDGDWSNSTTITTDADMTAPGVPTGVVGTGGVGQVSLSWTAPSSANYAAVNIYRNTTNVEGGATLVHTEYGSPSAADSYIDTSLAAGTYYYWLKARNSYGVESASVATGAKTVTAWQEYTAAALDMDSTGWANYTLRQVIASAQLSAVSGTKVRVSLQADSSVGFAIDKAFIGYAPTSGDAYDFEATPAQLKFGGVNSVSAAAGQTIVSDEITFTPQSGKSLVISMHFSGTSSVRGKTSQTGWSTYFKATTDDAATVDATGYTLWSVNAVAVSKVELLG